jgi:hypothetical protein
MLHHQYVLNKITILLTKHTAHAVVKIKIRIAKMSCSSQMIAEPSGGIVSFFSGMVTAAMNAFGAQQAPWMKMSEAQGCIITANIGLVGRK